MVIALDHLLRESNLGGCQPCRRASRIAGAVVKLPPNLGARPAVVAGSRQPRDPQFHTQWCQPTRSIDRPKQCSLPIFLREASRGPAGAPMREALRPAGRRSRRAQPFDDAVPAPRLEARPLQPTGDHSWRRWVYLGETCFESWGEGSSAGGTGLDRRSRSSFLECGGRRYVERGGSSSHPYRQTQDPRHTTEKLNGSRGVAAATPPLQNVLNRSWAKPLEAPSWSGRSDSGNGREADSFLDFAVP